MGPALSNLLVQWLLLPNSEQAKRLLEEDGLPLHDRDTPSKTSSQEERCVNS